MITLRSRPESAGDFFDGTEIDEMLTLRVLTLSDERNRNYVMRAIAAARFSNERKPCHPSSSGRCTGRSAISERRPELEFREGDRVRLRPRKKADIFDIALDGKVAIVESVERDFEDRIHLAVTVEDDPGRDFGIARQIAHRFFFAPEEVELL